MTDEQMVTRKVFPNGDVALDAGDGLVYRTTEAVYHVELDLPKRPLSDEPYGVDLVRTTTGDSGQERQQRLMLAEYHSQMAAEEHVREVEQTLLDQGRDGLEAEMNLVDAMPFETGEPIYLVGLYPPVVDMNTATLNVLRIDGERLDIAPVACGPVADMAAIEQRLFEVQMEGDTDVFLKAATAEAIRSQTLAPHTPLFAAEGAELTVGIPFASEEHPDWPDRSVWDQPSTPRPAARMLPVTFGDDMTPFDTRGRYVPHHHDAAGTIHFFAVVDRPPDSPLPEDNTHELRYFRAQKTDEDLIIHDSLPVMPVADPTTSPWPLPALGMYLEDEDLATAQTLARHVARDNGLPFPYVLPTLDEPPREPETGWYHFDTGVVLASPQGVDDGYSVGVVDVYANHENDQWAARHLPMGEFDTLDEALERELQLLELRTLEQATTGFEGEPALYERIALAEADATLTDLLEQLDGHLPPDYDGDHEPEWEALTSKEWEAYRDYVRMIEESAPAKSPVLGQLPTATPKLADEALIASSLQSDKPYWSTKDFKLQEGASTWELAIVPVHDPHGVPLGYSAVCVVDFADLADPVSPDAPQRAQWLEVAQFQTEDRAQQFRQDFMSLVGNDELGNITGPALAGVVAEESGLGGQWQGMDREGLQKLKARDWGGHAVGEWHLRMDEKSPTQTMSAASVDLDL